MKSNRLKIGFLPLYIALYDSVAPEVRPIMEDFRKRIIGEFEKRGVEVESAPICRIEKDFLKAVSGFEKQDVDAIVTMHLAYSPSLESASALSKTELPVIVLNTTQDYDFSPSQKESAIMKDHGIHGVQDMCNLLIRNNKLFQIEAGHWQKSNVMDRVVSHVRTARVAKNMKTARVGRIGESFKGMGDFFVPSAELKSAIGMEVIQCKPSLIKELFPPENTNEVKKEIEADVKRFNAKGLNREVHKITVRTCMAVRKWIEKEKLSAFSFNFLAINKSSGLPVCPFLEASKAMARGIGYAGEGDVLTAGLVGALAGVYPETTFTEMFCPDWKGGTIFLSHMGEVNVDLLAGKPRLYEKNYIFSDAGNPAVAVGCLKKGEGVITDIAPVGKGKYNLIVAPVKMVSVKGKDNFVNNVRGWFKPEMPVSDFLEQYSMSGGTHHFALTYGIDKTEICDFGKMMGWNVVLIDGISKR